MQFHMRERGERILAVKSLFWKDGFVPKFVLTNKYFDKLGHLPS